MPTTPHHVIMSDGKHAWQRAEKAQEHGHAVEDCQASGAVDKCNSELCLFVSLGLSCLARALLLFLLHPPFSLYGFLQHRRYSTQASNPGSGLCEVLCNCLDGAECLRTPRHGRSCISYNKSCMACARGSHGIPSNRSCMAEPRLK